MEIEIDGKFINLKKHLLAEEDSVRQSLQEIYDAEVNHKYSDEEMFEMKAAFGEDATVVNILTGQKVKL